MENTTAYSNLLLNNVHNAVLKSFGHRFNGKELALLINRQPKHIIKALVDSYGDDIELDMLIDNISKIITGGMLFPRPGDDAKYRLRFNAFVKKNGEKYFKTIFQLQSA